jgi:ribosomal protein S18 acetylase RimI-like enzyme
LTSTPEPTVPSTEGLAPIPFQTVKYDTGAPGNKRYEEGQAPIIDYSGRKIVMHNVNGVQVPFYLSTGTGGKTDVPAGKWYPFFGIGSDGWINKTGGQEMANYYGSDALRQAGKQLDTSIGDIRNDNKIPKVSSTGAHIDFINQGFTPTANQTKDTITNVRQNIDNTLARINQSNVSVTPVTVSENTQQNQATNNLPEGFEHFEEVQPDGTVKAGIRRIEEKKTLTKRPNDPALEAEARSIADQIEQAGDPKLADVIRSSIDKMGGLNDTKKIDFWKQKLTDIQQQANTIPERPQETWDMEKIHKEGGGARQEDLRRVVKFLPTAPQEVQDQIAKSNQYLQEIADKINEAGYKLTDVKSTAPSEVQDLRTKFSQISGSTTRYLKDAEHIARNNRYANPESLAKTKILLDQDYTDADRMLGRTQDTATEWNDLVGSLAGYSNVPNAKFEDLSPALQEKITATQKQDGRLHSRNIGQFIPEIEQHLVDKKAATREANRQRQEEQRKRAEEKANAAANADAILAERLKKHKETLRAWLPDFGWATEGGKIIRDPETGEVVGRTTWEAKNEYLDSVRDSLGRSFNEIKNSVELALAGKKLNAKQHTDVNAVMDLFEELEQQFATELTEDEINELFQIAGYEENEAYIENTIYSAPTEEDFAEERPQAETLELKGQSKAEIEFDEKLAKAEANRKRQEEQRAKAAEAAGEFTLTGSNREADIAAAKGAQDLFASKPDEIAVGDQVWIAKNTLDGQVPAVARVTKVMNGNNFEVRLTTGGYLIVNKSELSLTKEGLGLAPIKSTAPKKELVSEDGIKITSPVYVGLHENGFKMLDIKDPRTYKDGAGSPYRTFEKNGVRIALAGDEVLYIHNGHVNRARGEEKETTIHFIGVDVGMRKTGAAKEALQTLADVADKNNIELYVEPTQLDKTGLDRDQLIALYKKFGFEDSIYYDREDGQQKTDKVLVRKSGAKAKEAPVTPEVDEEAAYEALQKQAEEDVDAGPIGQALARIENGDFETKAQIKRFVQKLERDGIIEDPSDIYESLSDREQYAEDVIEDVRNALDDVRDDAVQERIDELESEQDITAPVQKIEEPVEKYDEAERKVAEDTAKRFGGEVTWQEGDLALIRGYGILDGKPVYVFSKDGTTPRVDIESYTGSHINKADLDRLIEIKKQQEAAAAEKHKTNPFVKFVDGIALSPDISPEIAGVVTEWKKMLGLDADIYISTIEDATKNRNNFTGPMRAIGAGTLHANERGSALKLPDGSYFILFTKSTSKTKMLETLAHELGHTHEKEVYNEQPMDVKFAIKDAFHAWLKTNEGKTAREHILGMRAKTTGQTTTIDDTLNSKDLPGYWSRFSEWYADQTARWAMSSAKPVGIVEKYFAKLGAALRKFYNTVKGAGYLPNETFKSYMDKLVSINEKNRNIDDIPFNSIGRSRVAVDDDTNYKVMMSLAEKTRKEIIADYAGLKRRIQTMSRKIADVGSTLQSQKELNEAYKIADVYKEIIKSTEPKNDSADRFVAKAKLEYAAGNISKEVMDVIDFVNKKYPNLLEGLKLSVRMNKGSNALGRYEPFKQLVSLFKGTDGVTDAETIRHELCHTLEQLMTPGARVALIEEWSKALVAAEAKYVDKRSKEYFEKVKEFLQNPSQKTLEDASDACPDIKNLYQYLNPSEYWAVNAEKLMAAKMGTPWVRFVNSIKKLYEGIKSVFGYDNKYAVHQVFDQVFNGEGSHDKNGALLTNYLFKNGTKLKYASNIKKDNDLMNDYGVPETPSHESESVKEMLAGKFSKMKAKYTQFKNQPKDEINDLLKATGDAALTGRMKAVWFGAGLEAEEFKRYNGKIRNAFGEILPSVILKNAMKASYIYAEVIKLGHMQYDKVHENFMAKANKYSMGNVLRLQHELREKLGTALADKVINSYHAAKRARSMQNSYLDAMNNVRKLSDDAKAATDPVLKEKLKTQLEEAKKYLQSIRRAFVQTPNYLCAIDPVNPTVVIDGKRVKNIMFDRDDMPILNDEAVDRLIAQEKDHPQLAEILKNFTSVNHNMLDMMAFSGRISKGMADKLKAIKDYSPWTRIMDDAKEDLFGSRTLGVNTAGIKHFKLTRTERELENVVDSMMHNIGTMIHSSTKTYANVKIAREFATRRPDVKDPQTGKVTRGKIRVYPTEGKTENAVYFPIYANGKKVIVEIPNRAVGEAMIGLAMGPIEYEFQKTLAGFANFTRRSITFTGYFQAKQVFYDAPTAALVSGVKDPFRLWAGCFSSFANSVVNIVSDQPDSATIQILKSAGIGGFQGYHRETSSEFKIKMGLFEGSVYSKAMNLIDKIGDASDFSQREATYNRVLKESGDPALALLQANDIIDFSRHGTAKIAQGMRQTIPFMQAFATQMDALAQAAQGKSLKGKAREDAQKQFAKTALMLAGITLAYVAMCAADDDYFELDDDTRARNFYIPFSKKTFGYPILLPMHSTSSLFWKVMPELLMHKMITQGTKNEMDGTRMWKAFTNAFTDSMFGPTPVPSLLKPPIEILLNRNFYTGNTLTPRGMENLTAEEKYTARTSELGKFLSAATGRLLNPIEADQLGNGWAGSVYSLTAWASNAIFGENRVATAPSENPFLAGFVGQEVSRKNESLFYGLKDKTEPAYGTYMAKIAKGNEAETIAFYNKNKDLIQAHEYVSAVEQDLKAINKIIKDIGKSEAQDENGKVYTPEKKLELITQYKEMKSQLLNNVIAFRKQAGL